MFYFTLYFNWKPGFNKAYTRIDSGKIPNRGNDGKLFGVDGSLRMFYIWITFTTFHRRKIFIWKTKLWCCVSMINVFQLKFHIISVTSTYFNYNVDIFLFSSFLVIVRTVFIGINVFTSSVSIRLTLSFSNTFPRYLLMVTSLSFFIQAHIRLFPFLFMFIVFT